ncbi:MAG: methylaspartate ammonia-lyase [Bacilli bacterium]|nr:methylaspartate ammonia-lyase [Bacilli bacterium]
MKIVDVLLSEGKSGFYFDDQRAIKKGAKQDLFIYEGEPVTSGFTAIRQAGEAISVMLVLDNGDIAVGDCAAVQYSGAGGRDPLFLAKDFIPIIREYIKPELINQELLSFRNLAEKIDKLQVNGKPLHTAIRYGVTQAILQAVAKANHLTMAEVIQRDYQISHEISRIPIFGQCGDERYTNVDKMIIKEADVLPHGLINNIEKKLGYKGELLLDYVTWLRDRIITKRLRDDYQPILHLDVYGTIGIIFDNDTKKMADYIETLANAARPFKLRIEGPMDVEDREKQIEALRLLREEIDSRYIPVEIVADEWCNTLEDIKDFADRKAGHMIQIKTPDLGGINNIVEAILYCREKGIGTYVGGTCNETNVSAEVTTNIALACGADQVLAKPGMGFDEGYMIVNNEMNRVIAIVKYHNSKKDD